MKTLIKSIIARFKLFKLNKKRGYVFLFHDISSKGDQHFSDQYSSQYENFIEMINFIEKEFIIVPLNKIIECNYANNAKPYAAITFDDGFYSVYQKVYPVCLERKLPITIFINERAVIENRLWFTDMITNKGNAAYWQRLSDNQSMGADAIKSIKKLPVWEIAKYIKNDKLYFDMEGLTKTPGLFCGINELNEMQNSGLVSIHSHTANHYMLSECTEYEQKSEIENNKFFVERHSGVPDLHIALPFGKKEHYNQTTLKVCAEQGYKYIYTTSPDSFKRITPNEHGIYVIPRIGLSDENLNKLKFMINMSLLKRYNA